MSDLFLGHARFQSLAGRVVDACEVGPGVGKGRVLGVVELLHRFVRVMACLPARPGRRVSLR